MISYNQPKPYGIIVAWHLKEHWEWRVENSFAGLFQFVISLSDFFETTNEFPSLIT